MNFTDLGKKLDRVPERLRSPDSEYYLVREGLSAEIVYDAAKSIMEENGFAYVFAERTVMYFEKTGFDGRIDLTGIRNYAGYAELDELLDHNGIKHGSVEEALVLTVFITGRRDLWGNPC